MGSAALLSIVPMHQAVPSLHCAGITRLVLLAAQWSGLKRGIVPRYPLLQQDTMAPSLAILRCDSPTLCRATLRQDHTPRYPLLQQNSAALSLAIIQWDSSALCHAVLR